jgi:short-subunit dehydrogenase
MTTTWITGAGGAWGSAIARVLLDDGHDVVALGRHDVPALAEHANRLGRSWSFEPYDLAEPEAPLPDGLPGVLVHAAVSTEGDRAALTQTNYLGPVALIDTVAQRMLRRGCGHIGVLVPQNARLGLAGLGDFSAPQSALWTWCEARRDELAADPRDVTLTVVIPGRTSSPTQRFVSERSGHQARLAPPAAGPIVRAILAGRRRAGRRPYLAAAAMLVR